MSDTGQHRMSADLPCSHYTLIANTQRSRYTTLQICVSPEVLHRGVGYEKFSSMLFITALSSFQRLCLSKVIRTFLGYKAIHQPIAELESNIISPSSWINLWSLSLHSIVFFCAFPPPPLLLPCSKASMLISLNDLMKDPWFFQASWPPCLSN